MGGAPRGIQKSVFAYATGQRDAERAGLKLSQQVQQLSERTERLSQLYSETGDKGRTADAGTRT